jgi:hypothetical protein
MSDATCSVEEQGTRCTIRVKSRGYCKKHYERWLRHGDPLVVAKRGRGALLAELLAAGRATTDECIILTVRTQHRPTAKLDGTLMLASRAVWILAKGDPGELHVLHTCHQGDEGCINIRHLYLGTNMQNVQDMVDAGRARGGRQGNRKLKPEQVAAIRQEHAAGANPVELAERYGVSRYTVYQVARGDTWKTQM